MSVKAINQQKYYGYNSNGLQKISRKSVLSICDINPIWFGSFEEFLSNLTEKLTEADFEHVIVFREKPIKNVEEILLNRGAKIRIIKPSKYNIYNFIKYFKIIGEIRPKIVHFHFYQSYTILNLLKFVFDIKLVHTDHMGGRNTKSRVKKLLRMSYYYTNSKLFGCGVDKIVCVSSFIKSKYSSEYGIHSNKLCVIHNGINLNIFQKRLDVAKIKDQYNINDEFVVTCVGLRMDKGAYLLVKALPSILKQIPNIKILLVGSGNCKDYIETLIDKLNVKDNVSLLGKTPNINDIYNISSCVVIPSLFEEAFCFVAAEAVATEVPVIAFNSGAIEELFGGIKTVYVIPKNYESLANGIIRLFKTENDISALKDGRDEIVNNYSIETCASKYSELYDEILMKA